jgi:sugar phosphate isomerase/epimerase
VARRLAAVRVGENFRRARMQQHSNANLAMFGCNTYSYMLSQNAETCLARLADFGFVEFEVMIHPGHLWPADLSPDKRRAIRHTLEQRGLRLTTLNMPNIDINVVSTTPGMRAYSLELLSETVRLAGDLGARGVVIGVGKANPLFPADAETLPFAFLPAIGGLMDALERYGNDSIRIVYDVANAYFIAEDFGAGLKRCQNRLALVHLSDTGRQVYRHDAVGLGTVPFADVPRALAAVGYRARPMLEIISHDPDRDILASAEKLAALEFSLPNESHSKRG